MRNVQLTRKTKETQISLELNLDGSGQAKLNTPLHFLNHMLDAFCRHGLFDLKIDATGDIEIDDHHLVEDIGLVLGEAIQKAVGDKKGIRRYGHFTLPMDEVLAQVALDLSGRPFLVYQANKIKGLIKDFETDLLREFFQALTNQAAINLHVRVIESGNLHHMAEACFKAFAKALDMATQLDSRVQNKIPSTKEAL